MSIYRLAVLLKEPVRPGLLQKALETTLKRIPSFALKMKTGFFWYYFEINDKRPLIQEDVINPCMRFRASQNEGYLFRIRYFKRRVALEAFHAIADGTGAMAFLKTLIAEYLKLCGYPIPATMGVLSCSETPRPEEMEDAYSKYARFKMLKGRRESKAYPIKGTLEPSRSLNIITGFIPLNNILTEAKKYGVSLTEFLVGVYLIALNNVQLLEGNRKLYPVKVSVPVNMRRFYDSGSLRNFSLFVNPGIDPNYGEYSFEEVLLLVHHYMRYELTEKHLNARLAMNVKSERNPVVRIMPLFIKNYAITLAFHFIGETRFTSALSNMGAIDVPEEMKAHIERFEFLLGPSKYNKVNCTVLSYDGTLNICFSRMIEESVVEREFFTMLVKMGIPVKIESNQE
ncbi:MAG: hypothetical protein Q8O09_05095 [Bacillota bacterium]|nr:hypothetical protein [Bacillota bacterium]